MYVFFGFNVEFILEVVVLVCKEIKGDYFSFDYVLVVILKSVLVFFMVRICVGFEVCDLGL